MQVALSKNAQTGLKRLARPGMALRPDARGGFCVAAGTDSRRRAAARISALECRVLLSEGLIENCGEGRFRIAEAGRNWLARQDQSGAAPAAPAAQHPQSAALRRLRALAGPGGGFFSPAELRAAERLERDHRLAQLQGRLTADWSAPPLQRAARGPGAGIMGPEAALDARNRLAVVRARIGAEAADFLADLFWSELGIEAAERRRNWPPRSGKVALKLILNAVCAAPSDA